MNNFYTRDIDLNYLLDTRYSCEDQTEETYISNFIEKTRQSFYCTFERKEYDKYIELL